MKVDGKAIAKANLERRRMNQKAGDEAPHEVGGEIQDKGAHIMSMMNLIEAIHSKEPEKAHKHMMDYAQAYAKMKAE